MTLAGRVPRSSNRSSDASDSCRGGTIPAPLGACLDARVAACDGALGTSTQRGSGRRLEGRSSCWGPRSRRPAATVAVAASAMAPGRQPSPATLHGQSRGHRQRCRATWCRTLAERCEPRLAIARTDSARNACARPRTPSAFGMRRVARHARRWQSTVDSSCPAAKKQPPAVPPLAPSRPAANGPVHDAPTLKLRPAAWLSLRASPPARACGSSCLICGPSLLCCSWVCAASRMRKHI
jgi:hypothetical protein